MEARHRRDQDNLICIGLGVLAFGVWTVVRLVLYSVLSSENLGLDGPLDTAAYILILAIIAAVSIILRFYVFRHARAEGRGDPQGWGYVILSGLLALLTLGTIVVYFLNIRESFSDPVDAFVTLLLELTSLVTLIELIAAAVRVKAWNRRSGKTEVS